MDLTPYLTVLTSPNSSISSFSLISVTTSAKENSAVPLDLGCYYDS